MLAGVAMSMRSADGITVSCVVNGCGMREANSFWMALSTLRKRFTFSVAFYDVFVIRFSFSLKEATITISFSWRVSSIGTNTVFQDFLDGRQVGGLKKKSDKQN